MKLDIVYVMAENSATYTEVSLDSLLENNQIIDELIVHILTMRSLMIAEIRFGILQIDRAHSKIRNFKKLFI